MRGYAVRHKRQSPVTGAFCCAGLITFQLSAATHRPCRLRNREHGVQRGLACAFLPTVSVMY